MEALKANYIELRRAAKSGVAVIPMGSLEAHGPHLPCGTDCLIVEGIVARAAAACDGDRVAVFPTVRYSVVEWALLTANSLLWAGLLVFAISCIGNLFSEGDED